MSNRPKWAEAIRWFVTDDIIDEKYEFPMDGSDDALLEEVEAAVLAIFCRAYGHEIIDDQCNIPEHRFCVFCNRRETDITAPSEELTTAIGTSFDTFATQASNVRDVKLPPPGDE